MHPRTWTTRTKITIASAVIATAAPLAISGVWAFYTDQGWVSADLHASAFELQVAGTDADDGTTAVPLAFDDLVPGGTTTASTTLINNSEIPAYVAFGGYTFDGDPNLASVTSVTVAVDGTTIASGNLDSLGAVADLEVPAGATVPLEVTLTLPGAVGDTAGADAGFEIWLDATQLDPTP